MSNLESAIRERSHEVNEARGNHHYVDDVQVNIRVSAHIAAALDGIASALDLGSRTAAARFLVSSAVFDALYELDLKIHMSDNVGWTTVPSDSLNESGQPKSLGEYRETRS